VEIQTGGGGGGGGVIEVDHVGLNVGSLECDHVKLDDEIGPDVDELFVSLKSLFPSTFKALVPVYNHQVGE
jgi:hypothetical protein